MSSAFAVSGRRVRVAILGATLFLLLFSTSERVAANLGLALLSSTSIGAAGDLAA